MPDDTDELIQRLLDPEESMTRSDAHAVMNDAADRLSALLERNAELERDANDMRITLVIQLDNLIDVAERYANRMRDVDPDEQKRTLGAINHARQAAAPYRYNGPYKPVARCATCCEPTYRDAAGGTRCGCLDLLAIDAALSQEPTRQGEG